MSDSWFREQLTYLKGRKGRRIEWPALLRRLAVEEFGRIQHDGQPYAGKKLLIDRDKLVRKHVDRPRNDEELEVYRLYKNVHERHGGLVKLGGKPIWLVTCQVPNQGKAKGRRADLLGMRLDGSLVIFECKVGSNKSDSPLSAMLEGLDYLAHLLTPANLKKMQMDLNDWMAKERGSDALSVVPSNFKDVKINAKATHAVIVLAPQGYYDIHISDSKKVAQQWSLLSDRQGLCERSSLEMDFAVVNYKNGAVEPLKI